MFCFDVLVQIPPWDLQLTAYRYFYLNLQNHPGVSCCKKNFARH